MITFPCLCGQILKAKPEHIGRPVRCPKCKNVVNVPAEASDSPPAVSSLPRLRSEALRETTPVTSVRASSVSEGPVAKVAAAAAPQAAVTSISTVAAAPPRVSTTPAEPPMPPERQIRQRVAPPLPPKMVPNLEPAQASELAVAGSEVGARHRGWWIGGATVLTLLVIAVLIAAFKRNSGLTSAPDATLVEEPVAPAPVASADVARDAETVQAAKTQAENAGGRPKVPEEARIVEVEEPVAVPSAQRSAPPPRVTPPRSPGGLTGVSRQYDDLDCMRIQAQHSIRVPSAATILEIDGQRLPIANLALVAESPAPFLYLPRGTHAVRFRPRESPVQVTISSDLSQIYHEMRHFFNARPEVRETELLSRGAKAMDVHSAPFLLNLMGASQLGKSQQQEPAERKFRRALRVNPLFSPAHLNLATLLLRKGAAEDARRELELADATNVGNCFGLSPGIAELRRKMNLPLAQPGASEVQLVSYVTQESLSEEDRRLTALMQGLSKYAVEDAQRGKILNNLAVHFAETGRTELALDHFRSALSVLKSAGPERFKLAQQVLTHMSQACRKANFEEADEYDLMRNLVSP